MNCQRCGKEARNKYCSVKCQQALVREKCTNQWLKGKLSGVKGKTKMIKPFVRAYLIEKCGEKCCICGWSERNVSTGNVPIEVDHIDGNSDNNSVSNLRLICPNCHSLTATYKNLNKGNGRSARRNKLPL
jgi:hypothetical protein